MNINDNKKCVTINYIDRKDHVNFSIIGLCLLFISIPIMTLTIGGIGILIYSSIFLGVSIIFNVLVNKRIYIAKTCKYLLLIIIYMIISALFSPIKGVSTIYIPLFLRYATVIVLLSLCHVKQNEHVFLSRFMYMVGALIAVYAFSNPYYGVDNRLWFNFFGVLQDPNYFSSFFILPVIISYEEILGKSMLRIKIVAFLSMITMFYLIISTGSRGGTLAIFTAFIIITLFYSKSFKKKIKNLIIGSIGTLTVIYLVIGFLPADLISRFSLSRMITTGGAGRWDIWIEYINLIQKQNFSQRIFGYGLGLSDLYNFVPHNQYITYMFEMGIIGVFLFIYILIKFIKISLEYNCKAAISVYIGYMIEVMFVTITTDRYFWMNIAVLSIWMVSYGKKDNSVTKVKI